MSDLIYSAVILPFMAMRYLYFSWPTYCHHNISNFSYAIVRISRFHDVFLNCLTWYSEQIPQRDARQNRFPLQWDHLPLLPRLVLHCTGFVDTLKQGCRWLSQLSCVNNVKAHPTAFLNYIYLHSILEEEQFSGRFSLLLDSGDFKQGCHAVPSNQGG